MKSVHKQRMNASSAYRSEFKMAVERAVGNLKFYVLVTTNMHGGTTVKVFRSYRQASAAAIEFMGRAWARCYGDAPKPTNWSDMLCELSQHDGFKEDVILEGYRANGTEFEKVE